MKALIQRVKHASVEIGGETTGQIDHGILILLGVEKTDTPELADRLLQKILKYRIFNDADGKMNLNVNQCKAACWWCHSSLWSPIRKKGRVQVFRKAHHLN